MFDIGWSELVVIAVVALIAIGPKELPGVLVGHTELEAGRQVRVQRVLLEDEGVHAAHLHVGGWADREVLVGPLGH